MLEADFDSTLARTRLTKSQRLLQRRNTLHNIDSQGIDFISEEGDPPSKASSSPNYDALKTDGIVTFDQFEKSYWPYFDQGLTKRLGTILQADLISHIDL